MEYEKEEIDIFYRYQTPIGRILDTEARRILNQGIARGEARGRILEYIELQQGNRHSDDNLINGMINRFHLSREDAFVSSADI